MFECASIESLKRELEKRTPKKIAGFFNEAAIRSFLNSAPEDVKEKIFTISSSTIYNEVIKPLFQLNVFYFQLQQLDFDVSFFKLKDSNLSSRTPIITIQSFKRLLYSYEDLALSNVLSDLLFTEKSTVDSQYTHELPFIQENMDKLMLNPTSCFPKHSKVIQVCTDKYLDFFDGYLKLLLNFGKGCKYICPKSEEEALFFSVSNFFLEEFTESTTLEEELLNKIYANLLALGYIFENRILRAFQKNLTKNSSKTTKNEWSRECKETIPKKTASARLSFELIDHALELEEYEDSGEGNNDLRISKRQENIEDWNDKATPDVSMKGVGRPDKLAYDSLKSVRSPSDSVSCVSEISTSVSSVSSSLKRKRVRRRRRRTGAKNNCEEPTQELDS